MNRKYINNIPAKHVKNIFFEYFAENEKYINFATGIFVL
jgi:hypothetical protein